MNDLGELRWMQRSPRWWVIVMGSITTVAWVRQEDACWVVTLYPGGGVASVRAGTFDTEAEARCVAASLAPIYASMEIE